MSQICNSQGVMNTETPSSSIVLEYLSANLIDLGNASMAVLHSIFSRIFVGWFAWEGKPRISPRCHGTQ